MPVNGPYPGRYDPKRSIFTSILTERMLTPRDRPPISKLVWYYYTNVENYCFFFHNYSIDGYLFIIVTKCR